MTTLDEFLDERLQDPDFAQAWDDSEAEYLVRLALIEARKDAGMTQAELAQASGIDQSVISKLETGDSNPTIQTLTRIAKGMGKRLTLKFV